MGKKNRAVAQGSAKPMKRKNQSGIQNGKSKTAKKKPSSSFRDGKGKSSSHPVKLANPKLRKKDFRRKKNPDVSDDDSLPSESDEDPFSDDERVQPSKKKQKKAQDDGSDIEGFLDEDETDYQGIPKQSKKPKDEESSAEEEEEEDDDEEDGDDEAAKDGRVKVTSRLVADLEKALTEKPSVSDIRVLMRIFSAAVARITGNNAKNQPYSVVDSTVFNSVIAACLKVIEPALTKVFKFGKNAHPKDKLAQIKKNKNWKVLHVVIRSYLSGLTELLTRLQQEAIVQRVLRHVRNLLPFFSSHPKASKSLFKHLIQLWSNRSEKLRLAAFMALYGFLQMNSSDWILMAIKKMYVAYVSNSRVTTEATWPSISFMASSLVEVLSLKPDIAYQQAFVYIRQMAVHVRNATNQKNKETQAKVYNWPFMHCIYLWSKFIASKSSNPIIAPLAHPLIQVITSTIKVNPVKKYYPLMFHCIRALNIISSKSELFIPTIPLLFVALQANDLNKKPKTTSMKPFDFMSLLKFSDSQLTESNYRTGIADQVHELLIENLRTQCFRISFPELMVVPIIQIKNFLKDIHVSEVARKFRSLLTVIEDSSRYIKEQRKSVTFAFSDTDAVNQWEKKLAGEPSIPFIKFYNSWKESSRKNNTNVSTVLSNAAEEPLIKGKKQKVEEESDDDAEMGDVWGELEQFHDNEVPAVKEETEEPRDEADKVEPMNDLSDDEDGEGSDSD